MVFWEKRIDYILNEFELQFVLKTKKHWIFQCFDETNSQKITRMNNILKENQLLIKSSRVFCSKTTKLASRHFTITSRREQASSSPQSSHFP